MVIRKLSEDTTKQAFQEETFSDFFPFYLPFQTEFNCWSVSNSTTKTDKDEANTIREEKGEDDAN